MKLAFVNGLRILPAPGLRGSCPNCGEPVTAKCGKFKVWHWAHNSRKHCDPWWESEGEWHRSWKDMFPTEWQEIPLLSDSGERHVADVRTPHGLVIEFQRSTIHPDEVLARQAFYVNMIWVIDGCKNEFDPINFGLGRSGISDDGFASFHVYGRSKLFERWYSEKPVFIDFGRAGFWRIARFEPATKQGIVLIVDKTEFVRAITAGTVNYCAQGGPASSF